MNYFFLFKAYLRVDSSLSLRHCLSSAILPGPLVLEKASEPAFRELCPAHGRVSAQAHPSHRVRLCSCWERPRPVGSTANSIPDGGGREAASLSLQPTPSLGTSNSVMNN